MGVKENNLRINEMLIKFDRDRLIIAYVEILRGERTTLFPTLQINKLCFPASTPCSSPLGVSAAVVCAAGIQPITQLLCPSV